jgi:hypothetical protein
MTKMEALEKAIDSWERRLRWAKRQNPRKRVDWMKMHESSKTGTKCALCVYVRDDCFKCPLFEKYGPCGGDKNAYEKVSTAPTWVTFIRHTKRLIEQLRSLREKPKKTKKARGKK